jgi:hypothetical protein
VVLVRKLVLLVLVALMVGTPGAAAAAPVSWTVTPGGSFTASGGDVTFDFENGIQWYCSALALTGVAQSGTGLGNPVAVLPETPGASFSGCTGPFGIVPEYTQFGDWEMHAESYDPATDVVSGTFSDVAFNWDWPGCHAEFRGTLDFEYDNTSGRLEILPNPTLNDIFVDPNNDCLAAVEDTTYAMLDSTLWVVPVLRIVPS